MADFDIIESSRNSGRPCELFLFRTGTGPNSFIAYTNAEQTVTHGGITYEPIPIDRDAVKASGTLDKTLLNVRVPKTSRLAELFRVYPPSSVVLVTVRQGHILEGEQTDFLVCFVGRVLSCNRAGNEATLGCEANQTSLRRSALRQHFQYGCPHVLYGPRCRAVKRTWNAVVEEIAGTTLRLVPGWNLSGQPQGRFLGGLVEWDSADNREPRSILRVLETDVLLLSGFLRGLAPGDTVQVALGCPHDLRGCETVHNNVVNYGGDPWIPFGNPFGKNPF